MVQKGQLLFELDPRPFQAEINQAQARGEGFGSAEGRRGKGRGALHGVAQIGRGDPAAAREGPGGR